jgi:type II secretory pathway pseudopilin PulG
MPRSRPVGVRAGFTIMELLLAAVLTIAVFALAIPLLGGQSRAVAATAGRLDAAQGARFAQSTVDRELRMVGVNTLAGQPMLVQADKFAVTFNADLATRDADDMWSIYYDQDADSTTTTALQPPAMTLKGSAAFKYPNAPQLDKSGLPGRAETVTFWVSADSSSPRANEYVLFRAVNRDAPKVVATGLYIKPGDPFFKYLWAKDSTGAIDTVPAARMPLVHTTVVHGSLADTGETASLAAQIDRVRSVVLSVTGQYQDAKAKAPVVRKTTRISTSLINMTMLNRPSCGLAPSAVTAVAWLTSANGQPDHMNLAFTRATDDGAGERDVERYLIYRSINGGAYGEPIDEVPANNGGAGYVWTDADVKRTTPSYPGANTFQYAVVVQDCQPQVSGQATTSGVSVPTVP